MAKLQRKSAKVFAEQAQAAIGGIAQFGSLAAGNIQYSKDVDVIQALDAYKQGWTSAVMGNKSPALEDRNALDYLLSYQQAYIMQHGVPEWLSTETYYTNSYVVDGNGELRVSIIDNNTGHNPTEDNGGQYWGYAGARGSGKQVGEVYFSQSSSASDNKGALPLFTGEVISNADNLYPQFYAWVLAHTSLCKTEGEYQTAISTYGECPFYVIDDTNKTIRLPKLVNYIKMANTTQGVTQSAAGLPNITGFINANYDLRVDGADNSALYSGAPTANNGRGNTSGSNTGIHFDASRSNAIYGNSNTVTPAHTTVFPWVFAFNAAIPASTAQAAEFQTALSSKADTDLSNISSVLTVANALSADMDNYTTIASSVTFTAPLPGWISFTPVDNTNTTDSTNRGINGYIAIDGKTVLTSSFVSGSDSTHPDTGWYYIGTSQTCYHTMSNGTVYFYPIKGV